MQKLLKIFPSRISGTRLQRHRRNFFICNCEMPRMHHGTMGAIEGGGEAEGWSGGAGGLMDGSPLGALRGHQTVGNSAYA